MEYGITILLGNIAERHAEDVHAHDMVGTRAACLDKVRHLTTMGPRRSFSSPADRTL
jgi:hypothetical protein